MLCFLINFYVSIDCAMKDASSWIYDWYLVKLIETNWITCGFMLLHVYMYCTVLIVVVYVYDELKTVDFVLV